MEMLRKSIVNRRSVVSRTSMVDDTPIMDANISVRLLESASPEPVEKSDDDEGPVVVEEDDFEECHVETVIFEEDEQEEQEREKHESYIVSVHEQINEKEVLLNSIKDAQKKM